MMTAIIDAHREDLGIEPICRELTIAPSSRHEHSDLLADPCRSLPILAGVLPVLGAVT